jgi:hypothetical protein
VKQIKRRQEEFMIICHVNLIGRQNKFGNLMLPKSQWSFKILMGLATDIREYDALSNLKTLGLHRLILSPPNWTTEPPLSARISDFVQKLGVNVPQAWAICRAADQKAGFSLIQGPPGSGKTKTILGLIGVIQTSSNLIHIPVTAGGEVKDARVAKKSIMICAPSNAAIDELARRLMKGIKNAYGVVYFPKLLRIGKLSSVHSDVKEIHLVSYNIDILQIRITCWKKNSKRIQNSRSMKTPKIYLRNYRN